MNDPLEQTVKHFTDTNDPNPLREYLGLEPRCLECDQPGNLDSKGICTACWASRMADMEAHYASREIR